MILSDRDIKAALESGRITITPFDEKRLQPASVDLTLDRTFLLFDTTNHTEIDVKKPVDGLMRKVVVEDGQAFVLHPGEFALALIAEETGVANDVVGRLEGKSSVGRLGIIIHATAGYLDPGNKIKLTLELSNVGALPVKLYPGMPIAQIAFEPLSSPCEKPYGKGATGSNYYGAQEPQASQMWKNFMPTLLAVAALSGIALLTPHTALAQSSNLGIDYVPALGYSAVPYGNVARGVMSGALRAFASILGIFLVSQAVWGWFLLKTHGGNVDRENKAKATFHNALKGVGLMMVIGTFMPDVVNFILNFTHTY